MIIINWIVFLIWATLVAYAYRFVFDDVNMKALLLALPTVALIIFAIVFVFNRGSSVAQLSSSAKLWSLWFNHYFTLMMKSIQKKQIIIIPYKYTITTMTKVRNG